MTKSQVESLGFKDCSKETYSCSSSDRNYTILGQKVDYISVRFSDDNTANEISVSYPKPSKSAIKDLTNALGKGKSFNYKSFVGAHIIGEAWIGENNTAISVKYEDGEGDGRLRKSLLGGIVKDMTSSIDYEKGKSVVSLIKQIEDSNRKIDKSDL